MKCRKSACLFWKCTFLLLYIEYFRGGCCLLLSYTYALCYTYAGGCACTVLLTLPSLRQCYLNICLFIWLCIRTPTHTHTPIHSHMSRRKNYRIFLNEQNIIRQQWNQHTIAPHMQTLENFISFEIHMYIYTDHTYE